MIESNNEFEEVIITCDNCGEQCVYENSTDWSEACKHFRELGWKITKDGIGDWVHHCPSCKN